MTPARSADLPLEPAKRADWLFPELAGGLWLAKRLGVHGVLVNTEVLAGVTDAAERRRRLTALLREAIVTKGCEVVLCGRGPDGKANTYAQAFERWSGEKLEAKPTRKGKETCSA